MSVVDLGCGPNKRAPIGVDRSALPGVDHVVALGFEPLPFGERTIDKFIAFDFVEHVPRSVWVIENGRWREHRPFIFLMNEVWRCLVHRGCFEHQTPLFPNKEVWQDPTHQNPWTAISYAYFCKTQWGGTLPGIVPSYGIECDFELVKQEPANGGTHIHEVWRKP